MHIYSNKKCFIIVHEKEQKIKENNKLLDILLKFVNILYNICLQKTYF